MPCALLLSLIIYFRAVPMRIYHVDQLDEQIYANHRKAFFFFFTERVSRNLYMRGKKI